MASLIVVCSGHDSYKVEGSEGSIIDRDISSEHVLLREISPMNMTHIGGLYYSPDYDGKVLYNELFISYGLSVT